MKLKVLRGIAECFDISRIIRFGTHFAGEMPCLLKPVLRVGKSESYRGNTHISEVSECRQKHPWKRLRSQRNLQFSGNSQPDFTFRDALRRGNALSFEARSARWEK